MAFIGEEKIKKTKRSFDRFDCVERDIILENNIFQITDLSFGMNGTLVELKYSLKDEYGNIHFGDHFKKLIEKRQKSLFIVNLNTDTGLYEELKND